MVLGRPHSRHPPTAGPATISARIAAIRRAPAAASATAPGAQQAATAVNCSVPNGQCGREAVSRANTSGAASA